MTSELKKLQEISLSQLQKTQSLNEVNSLFLKIFGRHGSFTNLIKKIKKIPYADKPLFGQTANKIKTELEREFSTKRNRISQEKEKVIIDVTEPGIAPTTGHLHPQTLVLWDLLDIFNKLGFDISDGPEIETDWYNFASLNFPPQHPARDTQQSLHVETYGKATPGEIILRTQTSAMQVRVMEASKLPLRVIVPGKCFRYEAVDASHGFEFWQLEGFAVDKNITLTDLFGTITYVLKKIIGVDIKLRFACTNFPFVEPGVDTYMECTVCKGTGCSFCKLTGWSEIMPAGMIHPNVLKAAQIDSHKWQGYAFAIGLSRLVTQRYGMDDLRLLVTPDLRILNQF